MKPTRPLLLLSHSRQTLEIFLQNTPINFTLYGQLLQLCTDRRLIRQAHQLHARLILTSTASDAYLSSKLIAFYSKTHRLPHARYVFDEMPQKTTFTFNALLIAYCAHSLHYEALYLFKSGFSRMGQNGDMADVRPDSFSLSCVLKAMSEVGVERRRLSDRMVHCYVVKNGLDGDVFVCNGLITCYSRCDDLVSARGVFDGMRERDKVSWNSMISGYSQGGFYDECKKLYRVMLGCEGLRPDWVTAVSVLHACAQSMDLVRGMEVHRYVVDNGIDMDLSVCNSIIAVYAKCGSLDYVRELFEDMGEKDEITYSTVIAGFMAHGFVDEAMKIFTEMKNPGLSIWNAVISGRVQNKHYDNVLDLVRHMEDCGFKPNSVTLSSILPAIPRVSHLKGAKEIHAYAIKIDSNRNIYVVTAIIDAYAKLGFLSGAQRVFDQSKDRSVIVWTAIISAYATHGDANLALNLFEEMLRSRTKPDEVTFTAVLSACAHSGLVDEAWEIFHSLMPKFGINPLVNHYACVVVCLSRAGKLSEAVEFVKTMTIEPTAQVWGALLSGASEAGDVELAEFVCDRLFRLEPENPTNYIVMANLYSNAGRWEEAEKMREKLNNAGHRKVAGSSRIEASGWLQSFNARGAPNEKTDEIF